MKNPPTLESMLEILEELLPGLLIDKKHTTKTPFSTLPTKSHHSNNKLKASVLRAEDIRSSTCSICKGPCTNATCSKIGTSNNNMTMLRQPDYVITTSCNLSHACRVEVGGIIFYSTVTALSIHPLVYYHQSPICSPHWPWSYTRTVTRVQQTAPLSVLSTALVKVSHS